MGICIYLELDRRSASSLLVLLACGVLGCADAMGAPPPLPVAASNWLGSGSAQLQQGVNANQMIVNQLSQRAILNWQSFDIGKDVANSDCITDRFVPLHDRTFGHCVT